MTREAKSINRKGRKTGAKVAKEGYFVTRGDCFVAVATLNDRICN